MRRILVLGALLSTLAGCSDGGDDETAETVTVRETVTTAAPDPEPIATVPGPDEQLPARCATQNLDVPGLTSLAAEGVDCSEAESVLLNWLQGCGGQEGACEPAPGYSCLQERFAGSASDVECIKGASTVRFSFE